MLGCWTCSRAARRKRSRIRLADRQSGWRDVVQAVSVYDLTAGKPATTENYPAPWLSSAPSTPRVFQVRRRTSAGAGSSRTVIVSGAESDGLLTDTSSLVDFTPCPPATRRCQAVEATGDCPSRSHWKDSPGVRNPSAWRGRSLSSSAIEVR